MRHLCFLSASLAFPLAPSRHAPTQRAQQKRRRNEKGCSGRITRVAILCLILSLQKKRSFSFALSPATPNKKISRTLARRVPEQYPLSILRFADGCGKFKKMHAKDQRLKKEIVPMPRRRMGARGKKKGFMSVASVESPWPASARFLFFSTFMPRKRNREPFSSFFRAHTLYLFFVCLYTMMNWVVPAAPGVPAALTRLTPPAPPIATRSMPNGM